MKPARLDVSYRALKPLALALLLLGGLGCHFMLDRKQQVNTTQQLKAMERASLDEAPIPELATDQTTYGKYRVLLDYYRARYVEMAAINRALGPLFKEAENGLRPQELASPTARALHRAQALDIEAKLRRNVEILDEMNGTAAEKNLHAMPVNQTYVNALLKGLKQGQAEMELLTQQLNRKADYFQKMGEIIHYVERNPVEMTAQGKLMFLSQSDADTYNRNIQELGAMAQKINIAAGRLQSIQRNLRQNNSQ
jgi:hypothetical protein